MTFPRLAASLLLTCAVALAGCGPIIDKQNARREAAAELRYPPTGQLLEVDGHRVHAHVEGSGPDLILLHGASGNTRDFTFDLVARLRDDYRVIAFDRPGLGWTDNIGALNHSPIAQADLLRAAADQLGVKNPIILGHSYGAAVAMAWTLRDPGGPSALVLVSGATYPWPGELGRWYTLVSSRFGEDVLVPTLSAYTPLDHMGWVVNGIFAPQDVPEGYVDYIGIGLSARRESFLANAQQIGRLKPYLQYMVQYYPDIRQPIEILHGDRDPVVGLQLHSQAMAADVPGANLVTLEGVGHMPHHAAPEEVVAAIHRAASRAGLRPLRSRR